MAARRVSAESQVVNTGELLLNIFEHMDGYSHAEVHWLEWPAGNRAPAQAPMVSSVSRTWRDTRYGQLASRGEHVVIDVRDDGLLPDGQMERLAAYLERGGGRGPVYVTFYLRAVFSQYRPAFHATSAVTRAYVQALSVHAHRWPLLCALSALHALEVIVGESVQHTADDVENVDEILHQYPDSAFFESIRVPTLTCVSIFSRSILQVPTPWAESVRNLTLVAQHHLSNIFEILRACPHLRFLRLEEPDNASEVSITAPATPLGLDHLETVSLQILGSHLPVVLNALAGTSVRDLAIWSVHDDDSYAWAPPPASVTSLTVGIRLTPAQALTLLNLHNLEKLVMVNLLEVSMDSQNEALPPIDGSFISALAHGRLPHLSLLDLGLQTWDMSAQRAYELYQVLQSRIHHPPAGVSPLKSAYISVLTCGSHNSPQTALLASLAGPVTLRHSWVCADCFADPWNLSQPSSGWSKSGENQSLWAAGVSYAWSEASNNGWGVPSDSGSSNSA
ncbi:hypothetical protein BD626DRAFT_539201 [Schizophyllum amplum]|uniref:Uncharacterized protein n=1 Tax=Schizophyllum amplum TaxID=97359 RepID=A0A550C4M4_9AGAR|nr:hypothetical protein BD626DRAFT_539201 [Auriculariopsis ampla]